MTNMRPSFIDVYMALAKSIAKRSLCKRLSVGAVFVSDDCRYVYGIGYNGQAAGVSYNYIDNQCTGKQGVCGCLHAEENAIINCNAPRTAKKMLICTHFPCLMCAKRIINLGGVTGIFYAEEYRDSEPAKKLLDRAGINFWRFE